MGLNHALTGVVGIFSIGAGIASAGFKISSLEGGSTDVYME